MKQKSTATKSKAAYLKYAVAVDATLRPEAIIAAETAKTRIQEAAQAAADRASTRPEPDDDAAVSARCLDAAMKTAETAHAEG